MSITARDRELIRFINTFQVASTPQLYELFFSNVSYQRCCQRLDVLQERGVIRRLPRDFVQQTHIYYTETKPSRQTTHKLIRGDCFVALKRKEFLQRFQPEYRDLKSLYADAYFEVWDDELGVVPFFLECQRQQRFDYEKYENAYYAAEWRKKWINFPVVVLVCEYKIDVANHPVEVIMTNKRTLTDALTDHLNRLKKKVG